IHREVAGKEVKPHLAPASADEASGVPPVGGSGVLDFGCLERQIPTRRLHSEREALRVRGRLCVTTDGTAGLAGVRVANVTTGTEGTVFLQSSGQSFLTGEIVLERGENVLEIHWEAAGTSSPRVLRAEI